MNSGKGTILVVDDEAHIRHVLSMKLRNAGYDVVTAEDGELALEAAMQHRPDLIITDYQMPFLSGLEMCRQLRNRPETAQTPALMLTARGFTLSEDDLAGTNIVGVQSKPFSPREILDTVEQLITRAAARI